MRCPNCVKTVFDNSKSCPYCRTRFEAVAVPVVPQATVTDSSSPPTISKVEDNVADDVGIETSSVIEKEEVVEKNTKYDYFILSIIIFGFVILGFIVVYQTFNLKRGNIETEEKTTTTTKLIESDKSEFVSKNVGVVTGFNNPIAVGNIVSASIYDEKYNVYSVVDVEGLELINSTYIINNNLVPQGVSLINGFEWAGIKFKVSYNDLTYLKDNTLSPLKLNVSIKDSRNLDFVSIDEVNYDLTPYVIYEENGLKNGESAILHAIYQRPINSQKLKICFGIRAQSMSCFSDK